jgi:hypothetical protein
VQRQYSGTLGKRANLKLGVSVNAVTEHASCPLDWRLFLPQRWDEAAMATRRAACHLPEQVHHRPKWQLVVDLLDELAGWELGPPVLLATITAAPVVTMDTNQRVVAAARAALGRLGLHRQVRVVHGDGYHGWPAGAPYDRIIVTCGCVGLSPRWLPQLAPGGLALVPVAHGGLHPIVAAWRDGPAVQGRLALGADFMRAAGPSESPAGPAARRLPGPAGGPPRTGRTGRHGRRAGLNVVFSVTP